MTSLTDIEMHPSWLVPRGKVIHARVGGYRFPRYIAMHPFDYVRAVAEGGHVYDALDKLSQFISQQANIKYHEACEKLDRMYPNDRE